MSRFAVPSWVREHNIQYADLREVPQHVLWKIGKSLRKFNIENPEVSIVIPAFNEEKNILRTLSSLAAIKTDYKVEIRAGI